MLDENSSKGSNTFETTHLISLKAKEERETKAFSNPRSCRIKTNKFHRKPTQDFQSPVPTA